MHNRSTKYSQEFQRLAVAKYLSRGPRTVVEVTRELGISPTYIYKWVNSHCDEDLKMRSIMRSAESLSAQEKLKLVLEYEALPESERGEYLRTQGVTSERLNQWKQTMAEGLGNQQASDRDLKAQIKRLEKELARKDRALAEAAALLILQKKCRPSTIRRTSSLACRALPSRTFYSRGGRQRGAQVRLLSAAGPLAEDAAALAKGVMRT